MQRVAIEPLIREYNIAKSVRHPNSNEWMKMYAELV